MTNRNKRKNRRKKAENRQAENNPKEVDDDNKVSEVPEKDNPKEVDDHNKTSDIPVPKKEDTKVFYEEDDVEWLQLNKKSAQTDSIKEKINDNRFAPVDIPGMVWMIIKNFEDTSAL
ncbi:hypothetical protein RclHR1_01480012 [Rhizophagus clarus]|uniref:Uncharacterized protein n=1 Tax=Rhizophagus clarus TaxID=94130 RepID=A0A2Z6QDJ6_9GLOM|nr:hypothetical protein RclHR1_01480012 [Rhizophagus clarus]